MRCSSDFCGFRDRRLVTVWLKIQEEINKWLLPSDTKKEYKSRHDWAGNLILWESCKALEYDYADEWYMHKPKCVLENKTWNSVGLMEHPILVRRPDQGLINKKKVTCHLADFTGTVDYRVKIKERKMKDKLLWPCLRAKKVGEYESDEDSNCCWCYFNCFLCPKKETGDQRKNHNHPDRSTVKIIQNT